MSVLIGRRNLNLLGGDNMARCVYKQITRLYAADEITTRVALDRYAGEKAFSRLGLGPRAYFKEVHQKVQRKLY